MAETMLMVVDIGETFTDFVPVYHHATDELRRRGHR